MNKPNADEPSLNLPSPRRRPSRILWLVIGALVTLGTVWAASQLPISSAQINEYGPNITADYQFLSGDEVEALLRVESLSLTDNDVYAVGSVHNSGRRTAYLTLGIGLVDDEGRTRMRARQQFSVLGPGSSQPFIVRVDANVDDPNKFKSYHPHYEIERLMVK